MDDKKINDNLQVPTEIPQPIYETVPVDTAIPEEVSSNVAATDQTDFSQVQPEIAPLEEEPIVYKEPSKLPIIFGAIGIFLVVFISLFFLLSSRNSKKVQKAPQNVSLTYWGLWEEKEVMEPLIKEYQQKNPNVTIVYEKKTEKDYRKKLLTWISNGQGPDIFRFHNTWMPELLLPDPGNTQKIALSTLPETLMTYEEYQNTFYPIHVKDLTSPAKKKIYGLPLMVDSLVMVVNEDLLKKAGISTIPTNWDEMISAASQVTVKGKDNTFITSGFAAGTAGNVEHFSDIFGLMLLLNGGNLFHLDAPEGVGTLEAYRKFAEEPNNVWSDTMSNSITSFAQGRVGIIFAPSWEIHTIKATSPDLKIIVAPIPAPPGGTQLSLATYWAEGVSIKSKNQEEAWKFLLFLASKESQTKLYEVQSAVRMFGAAYSRMDLASLLIQDQYLGPVIKQASEDKLKSFPLISNTFDDGLNDEVIRFLANAINGSSQGVSYTESMKRAKEGVDLLFQRYNIIEPSL